MPLHFGRYLSGCRELVKTRGSDPKQDNKSSLLSISFHDSIGFTVLGPTGGSLDVNVKIS